MSFICSLSETEKFKNQIFLDCVYLAARATADWLCGGNPKGVHGRASALKSKRLYGVNRGTASHFVEFGTDLRFYERIDPTCDAETDEDLAFFLNQALIWVSGSAALYAAPYGWGQLNYAYDGVWNDIRFARSALCAVSSNEYERKSVVFAIWDGALQLFGHPRVKACVEGLAAELMARDFVGDETGELTAHFEAHLADLRVGSNVYPVIAWPTKGIAVFTNPNWGALMLGSASKGRVHYSSLRHISDWDAELREAYEEARLRPARNAKVS